MLLLSLNFFKINLFLRLIMSSNLIGSLIWILFIFLSVSTHMIIKSLTGDVDFIITIFSRFVYSLPILFILAYIARKKLFLQINSWKNILLRSCFGFVWFGENTACVCFQRNVFWTSSSPLGSLKSLLRDS